MDLGSLFIFVVNNWVMGPRVMSPWVMTPRVMSVRVMNPSVMTPPGVILKSSYIF